MPENMSYLTNSSNNASRVTTLEVFGELDMAFDPENIESFHWNKSSSTKVIFKFSKRKGNKRSGSLRSS